MRKTRLMILTMIGLILGTMTFATAATDSAKEKQATAAAEKWLDLVDAGKYAASWETAAKYFQNAISREKWEQTLDAVRKPLGKLIKRKLISATYKTALPAAPDGQYVVIQFEASFVNKKNAIETVTPMLSEDGKWRVSGYYIK